MQVSWIEADDLKDLLARIAPHEPAAPVPSSWDAIPAMAPDSAASFLITAEDPFVKAEPPQEAARPSLPPEPEGQVSREDETADATAAAPLKPTTAPAPAVPAETPAHEDPSDRAAAALPLSRIRDKLRAIRQRANEAGMLGKAGDGAPPPAPPAAEVPTTPATPPKAPSPALNVPRFEAPTGGRQERLLAFANWARQILHEDGGHLLVMNDDGELLWGGEAKAGLVLSAMMAWGATLRSSASTACGSLPVLHQVLASGHTLTAIPCETMTGILLHAAVVGPARVPDEIAMQLRQALIRAAGTQFA